MFDSVITYRGEIALDSDFQRFSTGLSGPLPPARQIRVLNFSLLHVQDFIAKVSETHVNSVAVMALDNKKKERIHPMRQSFRSKREKKTLRCAS